MIKSKIKMGELREMMGVATAVVSALPFGPAGTSAGNGLPEPTGYQAIGWLVVAAASLCVVINQVDDFFERRKTKPGFPPVEQLDNSQKSLAERVAKLEASIGDIRREMKEDREALAKSGSARAAGIYKKVDEVRSELSENLETVRRELSENQRSLPNEIVTMLKNMNAI